MENGRWKIYPVKFTKTDGKWKMEVLSGRVYIWNMLF